MARQPAGMAPLPPERKWRAITIATVMLVPAFWALLGAVVTGDDDGGSDVAAAGAFAFAIVPFVYVALAFLSEHPRPPAAVLRAMGVCLLAGAVVTVLTTDAVTGYVAGVGAGGVVALRADEAHTWRSRSVAVVIATACTFALAATAGAVALLPAPVFVFTGLGIADHLAERDADRAEVT